MEPIAAGRAREALGPGTARGAREGSGEGEPRRKRPNLGRARRMEQGGCGEGSGRRGARPRAPAAGERESGVCAALLENKKERGGASYCSAGKLQPALLIGLTEP